MNTITTGSTARNSADLSKSNSLADLAARIRAEHEQVVVALARGIKHAINAGELLLEAKAQIKHGQWLSWLSEHCAVSERTAQLYMRIAQRRAELEAKAQGLADLTLEGAARLLAKSGESNIETVTGDDSEPGSWEWCKAQSERELFTKLAATYAGRT